jgi:hypothetical protein
MKKIFPIIILFIFLSFVPLARAAPIIENVSIQPSSLWLGESATVSLNCYDNENNSISQVYVNISGPNIILPTINFNLIDNSYTATTGEYLDRAGQFNAIIYCVNNASQTASTSLSFTVSKLTGYINSVSPSPAYVGDTIEIDFFAKKDNVALSSGVTFNVSLNNQPKSLKQVPAFDTSKGWMLKIDSPEADEYTLTVSAFYDRASVTNSSSLQVKSPIQFEVVSLSKDWVKSNENITIELKALEKNEPIQLKKEYLNVRIGSVDSTITEISQVGSVSYIKIVVPDLSPGSYGMTIDFNYKTFSYRILKEIEYVVPISGKIVDSDNKGINVAFKFKSNSTEKTFYTDASGSYSGDIPPGIYNLQMNFPHSILYLHDASINSFENPIKYFYLTDISTAGVRNAAGFVYEIGIHFSSASIEMEYDDSKVLDETKLDVYKCSNWNSGRKVCNSEWNKVPAEIDTIRNLAKVNTTSLSAYVIGERKGLSLDFKLEKNRYSLKEPVKIKGIVYDELRNSVSNITVRAQVMDTTISVSVVSDNSGIFSLEFLSPEEEGDYILILSAEGSRYLNFNKTLNLSVERSKGIVILIPDTIKINRGENLTVDFSVLNTGQTDFSDLNLSLEGIPKEYFSLQDRIDSLKAGEEVKIPIVFSVPEVASQESYTSNFKITAENVSEEKTLIFTILVANKTQTGPIQLPSFGLPSGMFTLPAIGTDVLYILILSIVSFSVAMLLRKRKIKTIEREEIKNLLLGIKKEINRENSRQEKKPKVESPNLLENTSVQSVFDAILKKDSSDEKDGQNG